MSNVEVRFALRRTLDDRVEFADGLVDADDVARCAYGRDRLESVDGRLLSVEIVVAAVATAAAHVDALNEPLAVRVRHDDERRTKTLVVEAVRRVRRRAGSTRIAIVRDNDQPRRVHRQCGVKSNEINNLR